MELFRYGIIAEPCYRNRFKKYIIREISPEGKEVCKIIADSIEFLKYEEETAGLIDLLKDCEVFICGNKVTVDVDFNKLQELEYKSTDWNFPQKKR